MSHACNFSAQIGGKYIADNAINEIGDTCRQGGRDGRQITGDLGWGEEGGMGIGKSKMGGG